MKLRVLPYVTVEVDDRLRRRLRAKGERLRLNVRAYLLSAADDVDTASDRVRGLCDRAVYRVDAAVAGVNDKNAPSEAASHDVRPGGQDGRPAAGRPHLAAVREAG
ncbi:hypothetical protein [Mycolicibacterium gadium]|uniref:Uncharacterized protein n=1 Tax=Mycolicibacterium gadium TaxID=1794 RepID=A0A7I7WU85_MYCGU|nr:hypothetical protein [Mycolicibacterium gadium]BBZ20071.1 hypothetical protein MGAD_44060 [Mycolicibacterium gadium]